MCRCACVHCFVVAFISYICNSFYANLYLHLLIYIYLPNIKERKKVISLSSSSLPPSIALPLFFTIIRSSYIYIVTHSHPSRFEFEIVRGLATLDRSCRLSFKLQNILVSVTPLMSWLGRPSSFTSWHVCNHVAHLASIFFELIRASLIIQLLC